MKNKALVVFMVTVNTLLGFVIGRFYERTHWLKKEVYAVYDRSHDLEKCTMDYKFLLHGLKDGDRIVAGNRRAE